VWRKLSATARAQKPERLGTADLPPQGVSFAVLRVNSKA
jgi:hypothetical protein